MNYNGTLAPSNTDILTEQELLASEELLVQLCCRGNRLAQKVLYEQYYAYLLGVCIRYVSEQNLAEDILHDCFIKIFKNLKKFKAQAKLKTWLTRVVINHNLDLLRKKKIFKHLDELSPGEVNELEVDNTIISSMSCREVLDLMNTLPVGYRTVLNLFSIDGLSHREIAEQLGINEGSSRSQLSKARRMLKDKLEGKEMNRG